MSKFIDLLIGSKQRLKIINYLSDFKEASISELKLGCNSNYKEIKKNIDFLKEKGIINVRKKRNAIISTLNVESEIVICLMKLIEVIDANL